MPTIFLPPNLNANNFRELFHGMVSPTRAPIHNQVVINFNNLSFIDPTGVTLLSNFIQWLFINHVLVSFDGIDPSRQAVKFLDDSGFFERYLGGKLNPSASVRGTTKPLEFINAADSFFWLRNNLLTWLITNSNKPATAFWELLNGLQEIFQNIRDHSDTQIGSVFAQYFPSPNTLSLSISDIGIGIPNKVKLYSADYTHYADSQAIIKACEYEFTTSSHAGNAGRGLANLIDHITKHYNGKVTIISDQGYVQYRNRTKSLFSTDRDWIYPGCMIDIEIRADQIPQDQEEDFTW